MWLIIWRTHSSKTKFEVCSNRTIFHTFDELTLFLTRCKTCSHKTYLSISIPFIPWHDMMKTYRYFFHDKLKALVINMAQCAACDSGKPKSPYLELFVGGHFHIWWYRLLLMEKSLNKCKYWCCAYSIYGRGINEVSLYRFVSQFLPMEISCLFKQKKSALYHDASPHMT